MTQDSSLGAVPNVPGAVYRQTLNNTIQAMATWHAGLQEPPIVYPFMQWWDLNGYVLRMRDPANTSWVTLGYWADNRWWPIAGGDYPFGLQAYFKTEITTRDPLPTDDWISGGYWIGSLWVNYVSQAAYLCMSNAQNASVWKQITGVPAGTVCMWAGSVCPEGWLPCDNRAVSRTLYSKIFAAIGSTWGAGDGWTTFNLPNMQLQFVRGWHSAFPVGSWWPQDMLSHSHATVDGAHAHLVGGTITHHRTCNPGFPDYEPVDFWLAQGEGSGIPFRWAQSTLENSITDTRTSNIYTQAVGGGENRPAAISMMYIIKS